MRREMRRRAVAGLMVLAGMAAAAPAANATITPSASTSTSTPLAAGATGNLDLDLKFAPSSNGVTLTDSPKTLAINLPPGMLADAAIAGGSCLTKVQIDDPSPCQVGSGEIETDLNGLVPAPASVNFYLVPPPTAGDLAGLAVASGATQVGTTGDIRIRPSGDPKGVGVSISLNLPNRQAGQPIDITEIDSTFTGLRFPTTCPATPSAISVAASSYADPTVKTASLPLAVAGCGALPFSPRFAVTATKDRNDPQVAISTTITQAANESPAATTALSLPIDQLKPALGGLRGLCGDPATGRCTPVASVAATSPDYPKTLTGIGYLTGSISALKLTLIFPPPFPLTLTGSINLKTNVTTFSGIPDLPITDLVVSLSGGDAGLFTGACAKPTGTASAALTDQNGDKSAKVPARFTIGGCPNPSSNTTTKRTTTKKAAGPRVTATKISGLKSGKPSLRLTVTAAAHTKLRTLTVHLPRGLTLVRHRVRGKLTVTGVSLRGARVRTAKASRGLVISLRSPARKVTVVVSPKALRESAGLKRSATAKAKKKRLKQLRLTVAARTSTGRSSTVHVTVKNLGR